jgi:prophage regulatory protein
MQATGSNVKKVFAAAEEVTVTHITAADDRIVCESECRIMTGLSRTTRWRLERIGAFPRRRHLSENRVGWVLSEIVSWRATRPFQRGEPRES